MKLTGTFKGQIYNHKTNSITCWEKHNMIVAAAFDWVASLMSNTANRPSAITHIAFGEGTTTTNYNMTTLEDEVYRARVTPSWDAATRKLTFTGAIPVNSGIEANITEVGLFTAETGGVMFDRATFSEKGIDNNTSFTYNFIITITE